MIGTRTVAAIGTGVTKTATQGAIALVSLGLNSGERGYLPLGYSNSKEK